MNEANQKIQERTLSFAVRVVKLCKFLDEQGGVAGVLYKQLIRSGTSIGANVREAQSSSELGVRSSEFLTPNSEFKTPNCELVEAEVIKEEKVRALRQESTEIIKILIAITKKLKEKQLRTTNSKLRTGEWK